jgi:hypothetical protein
MGVKNWVVRKGVKASDKIAKLSTLSPDQIAQIQSERDRYFEELASHSPNDPAAQDLTKGLLAASSVEIFNAYLPQLSKLYVPISKDAAYGSAFNADYNIRYFNITKWVIDKEENSLEKLINVYDVLSDEDCNIALIFNRTCEITRVYLAVTNNKNSDDNVDANNFKKRLADAVRGNFPGSEWKNEDGIGTPPCLKNNIPYTVASASNIPAEKSEKFISQTIEKLLDGIVPERISQEYTLILLATPIRDVEERKLRLAELYSGLAPYAQWQTNFTYTESGAQSSNATFGVNVGASAGVQNGVNNSVTNSRGDSINQSQAEGETEGQTLSDSTGSGETDTVSSGTNSSVTDTDNSSSAVSLGQNSSRSINQGSSDTVGGNVSVQNTVGTEASVSAGVGGIGEASVGVNESTSVTAGANYSHGWNRGTSDTVGTTSSVTDTVGTAHSVMKGATESTAKALSKTVQKTIANNTAARSQIHWEKQLQIPPQRRRGHSKALILAVILE